MTLIPGAGAEVLGGGACLVVQAEAQALWREKEARAGVRA